ncbi:EscU/YscU/HrcU family type III secretion system export apparatus switch protein [Stutzerimonas stutzeri]|jgi:flagellar biosynthesis protein|uniref:Flagellar biosynthetic protein FlhB n=1 Tax=Stutzerimonas stutzeri TaxID=316 RepID=A0AA42P4U0_STUST|nr:EscU/YscU/HrcU family type III secretion system export apparatus switch protein [Stutzerimonas stutzeri]OHC18565.1 MAG: flagellar biosynthesis protein FlhB [Pseudomonadales bacterium RIFCSPHIGHO2_01_FULL_64_12]HAJ86695.1 flagellar biosynthesis protein FlhB [Pseudomonas sp.]AVX13617.1 EscU/YscU/HrcU family type III secretion system export apparatus switch protein [Stutzerimonas stutzeri]MBD9411515.1 flagellar biosynthesis protein FlhB [Stutzerimonas stutzeri]MDH1234781.1 EscU/YscU/HrcU famil
MTDKQPRQAIALSYDGVNAPSLSAKGDDELAEAILAIAREHEVPIYENADLVKLLARLELGDEIPEALYRTIAEIIAFAWYLKGKYPPGFQTASDSGSTANLPLLSGPGH